jgi:hypothetical protein
MSKTSDRSTLARFLPTVLTVSAAALLLVSLRLPLWHMRLEAPQYKGEEALKIAVYPNKYGGDLREIKVLNQYIGVHVPPTLPQFSWLPALFVGGAVFAVGASLPGFRFRRAVLGFSSGILVAGLVTAAGQAMFQMHDIGHMRDHHTVLAGVHDFTPPFLGTSRIAQFTVTSGLGLGAWFVGGAIAFQFAGAFLSRKPLPASAQKAVTQNSVEHAELAYQI